jgi:hypothetical protein
MLDILVLVYHSGMNLSKVHLLYEPRNVVPCIGILTDVKPCVIMFEFHAGV